MSSLPTDLFRYNTAATSFRIAFYNCSDLTAIPSGLFYYNAAAIDFRNTFNGCDKAQLAIDIFYPVGSAVTRFLNKSVDFYFCFYRTAFTGTQGTAPDLWNVNFGTGTPVTTRAYYGEGNSLTSLTNFADIPVGWQ